MPQIGWMIQHAYLRHERQVECLVETLRARNTPVCLISDTQDPVWPAHEQAPDVFMVLGGIRFVRDALRRNTAGMALQAFFGEDLHAWRTYVWKLPRPDVLNKDAELRTLYQLKHTPKLKHPTFIKPDHSLKIRDACVVKPLHMTEWLAECERKSIPESTLFWLSQPQVILAEFRVAVSKTMGIVDLSCYANDGEPTDEDIKLPFSDRIKLQDIVSKLQENWLFDDEMIMLDVCRTLDTFQIVECNAISSSGWYGLNVPRMIDAIEIHLQARWRELND